MAETVSVDRLYLVDIQVELRSFPGDSAGDSLQFGVAASDDGACASTLGRAIVFP